MPDNPSQSSPREAAIDIITRMPDDATFDEVIYRLWVVHKIRRGIEDVDAGRTYSHEEVREQIGRWLK
jgi:predicted transcriptional regulator